MPRAAWNTTSGSSGSDRSRLLIPLLLLLLLLLISITTSSSTAAARCTNATVPMAACSLLKHPWSVHVCYTLHCQVPHASPQLPLLPCDYNDGEKTRPLREICVLSCAITHSPPWTSETCWAFQRSWHAVSSLAGRARTASCTSARKEADRNCRLERESGYTDITTRNTQTTHA